jgi:hypothetical protein
MPTGLFSNRVSNLSRKLNLEVRSDLQVPGFGEGIEAAVVGFFDVIRETAGGQLLACQVIAQTVAARSFSRTAGIRAVAIVEVLVFLTVHIQSHKGFSIFDL